MYSEDMTSFDVDEWNGSIICFEGIEKIILPPSVELIGYAGFYYNNVCWGDPIHFKDLKEIVCDEDIKEEAEKAFGECSRGICNCRYFSEILEDGDYLD